MGKVDCITEMCEEQFNAGFMDAVIGFLINGFSIQDVSKCTGLPIEKLEELKKEIKSSK